MNGMKKLLVLLMAAMMLLTACGGEKPSETQPSGCGAVEETTPETETNPQEQTIQGDTWGAENGMSGYVEYKYDEEGREIERLLINGETGTLYRRVVTTYDHESFGEEQVPISETKTYGPNNILLYTMNMSYTLDGYPFESIGYDNFREESTIIQSLSGTQRTYARSQTIKDFRSMVLVYWIDHYGPQGLESRDYYWKDGTLYIREVYRYNEDGSYILEYLPMYGNGIACSPEFNDQGQLVAYWKRKNEMPEYLLWSFEYDAAGRLTRKTEYASDGDIERDKVLTYAEDGSLTQCSITYAHELFTFNYENGVLISRTGINNDISAMLYDYYPSGVVRTLICTDSSDFKSDFRFVYRFAEDGTLRAVGTYDYGMSQNDYYDIRKVEFYNPDGTLDQEYTWREDTETNDGTFVQYIYDAADSENKTGNSTSQEYLDPIPAEDEVSFIMDFLDSQ